MTANHVFFIVFVIGANVAATKTNGKNNMSPSSNEYPAVKSEQNNKVSRYSGWTPWSRCDKCWQSRVRICISDDCKDSRMYETRPCDRRSCLRQKDMKSINKRLHIFKEFTKEDFNVKNLGSKIWSRWSNWRECSKDCKTERYRMCKKPGRCKKKLETAYCYLENSNCETFVLHLLDSLDPNIRKYGDVAQFEYNNHITPEKKPKKLFHKKCGRPLRKLSMLKIIGGIDSQRNKWPWHVAVINKYNEVFCSGTLIAPRWVLTASHCVRPWLKVRLNEYNLSEDDGSSVEVPVEKYYRHPDFNHNTVDNDIALLKLSKASTLPVACLPNEKPKDDSRCSIMGWGKVRNSDDVGSPILQEAEIPIVNNVTCKRAYRRYYISDNMFCAGTPSGKVDTCAGDSGGGLMCRTKRGKKKTYLAYTVQGITSFGEGCGIKDKYGIYTNVYNYVDWIYNITKTKSKRRRTLGY